MYVAVAPGVRDLPPPAPAPPPAPPAPSPLPAPAPAAATGAAAATSCGCSRSCDGVATDGSARAGRRGSRQDDGSIAATLRTLTRDLGAVVKPVSPPVGVVVAHTGDALGDVEATGDVVGQVLGHPAVP